MVTRIWAISSVHPPPLPLPYSCRGDILEEWNIRCVPKKGMQQTLQGCRPGLVQGQPERFDGREGALPLLRGALTPWEARVPQCTYGGHPGEGVSKETCFWVNNEHMALVLIEYEREDPGWAFDSRLPEVTQGDSADGVTQTGGLRSLKAARPRACCSPGGGNPKLRAGRPAGSHAWAPGCCGGHRVPASHCGSACFSLLPSSPLSCSSVHP